MIASELRIGNLILVNGVPVVVGYGIITDLYQKNKGIKNKYLDTLNFAPIPLTEEWFIKLGFHDRSGTLKNRLGYGKDINTMIEIAWYKIGDDVRLQSKGSGWTFNTKIAYVHQLQNLYYALTGNELTIK